jgi:hypothetical protein
MHSAASATNAGVLRVEKVGLSNQDRLIALDLGTICTVTGHGHQSRVFLPLVACWIGSVATWNRAALAPALRIEEPQSAEEFINCRQPVHVYRRPLWLEATAQPIEREATGE